jgi:secreted trypsin-like serine protease
MFPDDQQLFKVALVRTGNTLPFCGGSLLSSTTIITAAHCYTDVTRQVLVCIEFIFWQTRTVKMNNHLKISANIVNNSSHVITVVF